MTRRLFLGTIALALIGGCARRYQMTLTNNHVITAHSKPKLNKTGDAFLFKDHNGELSSLPAGKVKTIEAQ